MRIRHEDRGLPGRVEVVEVECPRKVAHSELGQPMLQSSCRNGPISSWAAMRTSNLFQKAEHTIRSGRGALDSDSQSDECLECYQSASG